MPFNKLIPILELDPYASNVVLWLEFNGNNGDTNTSDSSSKNHSVSFNGTAEISNSQAKYGNTSLKLVRSLANFLTVGASSDWVFDGDFTVEGWFDWEGIETSNGSVFVGTGGAGAFDQLGSFSNNLFGYGILTGGGGAVAVNTLTHLAVSRHGSTVRIFKDGVLAATGSNSSVIGQNLPLYIGKRSDNNHPYGGYIDSLRITKGIARYRENFNPETDTFLN